jgi:hypothetical protein
MVSQVALVMGPALSSPREVYMIETQQFIAEIDNAKPADHEPADACDAAAAKALRRQVVRHVALFTKSHGLRQPHRPSNSCWRTATVGMPPILLLGPMRSCSFR